MFNVDPNESFIDGTKRLLSVINLLEDITQDAIVNFRFDFPLTRKIFQILPNTSRMANKIKDSV